MAKQGEELQQDRPIELRRLHTAAEIKTSLRPGETEAKIGDDTWRGTPDQIADKLAAYRGDTSAKLADAEPLADNADVLTRLNAFCASNEDAHVAIVKSSGDDEWSVGIEWGREAEDSPMVGAAAYGADTNLTAALEQALKDARA